MSCCHWRCALSKSPRVAASGDGLVLAAEREERTRERRRDHRLALAEAAQPQQRSGGTCVDRLVMEHLRKLVGEVARREVAPVAVLLECRREHDHQIGRERRIEPSWIGRLLGLDRDVEPLARRVLERAMEREALVEADAERPDVGAPVEPHATREQLLGRHVDRRAEEVAGAGHPLRFGVVHVARETEVEDHRPAVASEQEVLRLDVAMDDPALVHRMERLGQLHEELEDAGRLDAQELPRVCRRRGRGRCARGNVVVVARHRDRDVSRHVDRADRLRRADPRGQCLALDVAHRDERDAVAHPRLVDGRDAGMVDPRRRFRLAMEAQQHVARRLRELRQDLQRDAPRKARVLGEVDDSLPAAAELLHHAIGPDQARRTAAARRPGRRPAAARRRARQVLARDVLVVTRELLQIVRERLDRARHGIDAQGLP